MTTSDKNTQEKQGLENTKDAKQAGYGGRQMQQGSHKKDSETKNSATKEEE